MRFSVLPVRAARFHNFGPPEVLRVEEVPDREPADGEVLVRVHAIGVNYTDVVLRSGDLGPLTAPEYLGAPPELPTIPGFEGAGVVEAVGPHVTAWRAGDRVAFDLVPEAYAERVVAPVADLLPLPVDVPFETGAALPLQGLTAFYLLHRTHHLRAGETVLVHAGAGGVGLLAIQLAKHAGTRVIATVSTEAKADLARAAGADHAIGYDNFSMEVLRLTGDAGADVILDGVGRTTMPGNLHAAAFHGHILTYGWPSGVPDPIRPLDLMPRALTLSGGNLIRAYTADERAAAFAELCARHTAGALRVKVDAVLPLADAAEAHARLEGRASAGKLLLVP